MKNEMNTIYYNGSMTIDEAIFAINNEGRVISFEAGNNKEPEGMPFLKVCDTVKSLCNELSKIGEEYSYVELSIHL